MTTDAILNLLSALGFAPDDTTQPDIQSRTFPAHDNYRIEVNLASKKINYPLPLVVGDQTTSNFAHSENFVVLECVCRLLAKGYAPQHLELERKYKLGHTGKSGKADITVADREGNALVVIECKNWGEDYAKELSNLYKDGGQLFSYLKQDANIRWLALYALRLNGNEIESVLNLIQIEDRPEVLELLATNPDELAYQTANDSAKLHEVWRDQYSAFSTPNGLFDAEVPAYEPKKIAIKRKDLKAFTPEEGRAFYNEFAEILRHNNISDKSNAFNRILSLVLCKIVDEQKLPDEVTDFQIADIKEKPESIQDRLQKLYADGMKRFLKEEIIYFSDSQIQDVMNDFPLQHAKTAIAQMFREQKYYSNNEFAFKEVHNQKLFLENARVLNELLQLLQLKQFRYNRDDEAQFKAQKRYLGDFFELLLAAGYKQDEGQFFTPIPIARFIVSSLPIGDIVERKLAAKATDFLPTVIDYACGSGHFLIEAIDQIQLELDKLQTDYTEKINEKILHWQASDWTDGFIFGIEKDYRLARTAKLACFMNGDGEARITFGDGLENYHLEGGGFPETFDVLVANPPYSIKGFKTHTAQSLKRNHFELMEHLTDEASQIEVLFVERLKQLLHAGAVCGVILPSSMLSNAGIYTRAREMLLRYFEIRAVVEFGGNTFMATGTNTITLFLKRRPNKHAENAAIVAHDFIESNVARPNDFTDTREILASYAGVLGLDMADYESLLKRAPTQTLLESEWYVERRNAFESGAATKKLVAAPDWKKKTEAEQTAELDRRFYAELLPVEKDKFEFYQLVWNQQTLIVRAPSEGKAEKRWLGYDFSNRRGAEGINLYRQNDKHQTALYDEDDPNHPDKLNFLVRRMLAPEPLDYNAPAPDFPAVPAALEATARLVNTADCFDWTRLEWEKPFDLATSSADAVATTATTRVSEVCSIRGEKITPENMTDGDLIYLGLEHIESDAGRIVGKVKSSEADLQSAKNVFYKGDVLYGKLRPYLNKVYMAEFDGVCSTDILVLQTDAPQVLKAALMSEDFVAQTSARMKGNSLPRLQVKDFLTLKLHFPKDETALKQVADEIAAVESEEEADRAAIETARAAITDLINGIKAPTQPLKQAVDVNPPKPDLSHLTPDDLVSFIEMASVSNDGGIDVQEERTLESVKQGYTCFQKDDVIVAKITPCMENGKGALVGNLTNDVGFGSTEFFVLRSKGEILPALLFQLTQDTEFRLEAAKNMTGSSGHRRVPRSFIESYPIPVLGLPEQRALLAEIEVHEATINAAQARLDATGARKTAILAAYL